MHNKMKTTLLWLKNHQIGVVFPANTFRGSLGL